jgi:DNA cross-link repair 1A protein
MQLSIEGTANLIIHMLSVDSKWVHPLPMDVQSIIPNTGGVRVTLIEANHCQPPLQ